MGVDSCGSCFTSTTVSFDEGGEAPITAAAHASAAAGAGPSTSGAGASGGGLGPRRTVPHRNSSTDSLVEARPLTGHVHPLALVRGGGGGGLGSGGSAGDPVAAAAAIAAAVSAAAPGGGGAAATSPAPALGAPEAPILAPMDRVLAAAEEGWAFDAFALADATGGRPLSVLAFFLLHRTGLIARCSLAPAALARFLRRIEIGYHNNPYHNATHAADVLQTLHVALHRGGLVEAGYAGPHWLLAAR